MIKTFLSGTQWRQRVCAVALGFFVPVFPSLATASDDADDVSFEEAFELGFNDAPLEREIDHPEWFKESFLDLRDDLQEAIAAGKQGIALYFGQANCAYCKALMEINLTKPDIVDYVQENYDIIPLDIWGSRQVTMFNGEEINEVCAGCHGEFGQGEKDGEYPRLAGSL